ncbi:MAG: hypothetical protein WC869_00350 [Phycisphaerae bacterium]|jgi:hypothetical protein
MPAKSKAQLRLLFAKEDRGELPEGTAKRWAHHTPNIKDLPEHVSDKKKEAGVFRDVEFAPSAVEALKTAIHPALAALLGAGAGGLAGGLAGRVGGFDQTDRLGDYQLGATMHQVDPSIPEPVFEHRPTDQAVDALRSVGTPAMDFARDMLPEGNAGSAEAGGALVGAGLGGAAGLGYGMLSQRPKFAALAALRAR